MNAAPSEYVMLEHAKADTTDWNQIQTTDENGNSHTPEGVEGEPPSVIHAPEGYGSFVCVNQI